MLIKRDIINSSFSNINVNRVRINRKVKVTETNSRSQEKKRNKKKTETKKKKKRKKKEKKTEKKIEKTWRFTKIEINKRLSGLAQFVEVEEIWNNIERTIKEVYKAVMSIKKS